jgi:hypothetical protein
MKVITNVYHSILNEFELMKNEIASLKNTIDKKKQGSFNYKGSMPHAERF